MPNVIISPDDEFCIFVGFASALKREDEDVYNIALNRHLKQSALFKLLLRNPGKMALTEEECSLLRDFVNLTLNAYCELEEKNQYLKFDIINQIGGKKSRG
jgi:hypothetical protein